MPCTLVSRVGGLFVHKLHQMAQNCNTNTETPNDTVSQREKALVPRTRVRGNQVEWLMQCWHVQTSTPRRWLPVVGLSLAQRLFAHHRVPLASRHNGSMMETATPAGQYQHFV